MAATTCERDQQMNVRNRDETQEADVAAGEHAHLDSGASAIEYALLLGLIAIVIFTAMAMLGMNVSELYSSIATGY